MIDLVFVLILVYNTKCNLFIEILKSYKKETERRTLSEYFKMHNNQNDKV